MIKNKKIGTTVLAHTGISTTRIGLGLAALGRPGYINLGHAADLNNNYDLEIMENHVHQVLDRAWDLGVRYFDVARSYGKAEQFLASWLSSRNIKASEVTVGSKWGYTYTADWEIDAAVHEVKDHNISLLDKQWRESHRLLGEWMKLYLQQTASLFPQIRRYLKDMMIFRGMFAWM